jgi:cob(I)alamin adenosyltransferase
MDESDNPSGLVIVYTGNGKGKTTAALGLCLRAVGHGNKIHIIQFIKSNWEYGEREGVKRLAPEVTLETLGAGCIGILGDEKPIEEHHRAARKTLDEARRVIAGNEHDIVILDEINIATHLHLITVDDGMQLIRQRPDRMTLVLTGRYADNRIIEAADLVTEMTEIKHPFQKGRLSKKGIDF